MKFKANQRILNGMLMKEIKDLNATIRRHGEAHLAQDLLPQFTELVKKVEKLEGVLNFKLNDGPIHNHSIRIAKLETHNAQVNASENIARICVRLNDHDESIEALSETVDQLERAVYNSPFSKIVMEEYAEKIKTLEESNAAFLPSIPDIEILKTQLQGAIRDVDTLKIQFSNANLHYNGLIEEVLRQKKFLEKVQVILDRERDARIKKSPGYKKEITAQKKEHMVMDKHLDTMVKKGRPRKP